MSSNSETVLRTILDLRRDVDRLREHVLRGLPQWPSVFTSLHDYPTIEVQTRWGPFKIVFFSATRALLTAERVSIYRVEYELHTYVEQVENAWRVYDGRTPLRRLGVAGGYDVGRAARSYVANRLLPSVIAQLTRPERDSDIRVVRATAELVFVRDQRESLAIRLAESAKLVDQIEVAVAALAQQETALDAVESRARDGRAA